jgi:hypothetical protein
MTSLRRPVSLVGGSYTARSKKVSWKLRTCAQEYLMSQTCYDHVQQ